MKKRIAIIICVLILLTISGGLIIYRFCFKTYDDKFFYPISDEEFLNVNNLSDISLIDPDYKIEQSKLLDYANDIINSVNLDSNQYFFSDDEFYKYKKSMKSYANISEWKIGTYHNNNKAVIMYTPRHNDDMDNEIHNDEYVSKLYLEKYSDKWLVKYWFIPA